jgi:hypothetical protein
VCVGTANSGISITMVDGFLGTSVVVVTAVTAPWSDTPRSTLAGKLAVA